MRKLLREILATIHVGLAAIMSDAESSTNTLSDLQGEAESQGLALERMANALDELVSINSRMEKLLAEMRNRSA